MSTGKLIKYDIFDHTYSIQQQTTTVNILDIPRPEIWSYAERTIKNRFKDYNVRVNHAGLTVSIDWRDE